MVTWGSDSEKYNNLVYYRSSQSMFLKLFNIPNRKCIFNIFENSTARFWSCRPVGISGMAIEAEYPHLNSIYILIFLTCSLCQVVEKIQRDVNEHSLIN